MTKEALVIVLSFLHWCSLFRVSSQFLMEMTDDK
jgi:hypothetical protein